MCYFFCCWPRPKKKRDTVTVLSSPRVEFDKIYDKIPQFVDVELENVELENGL